MNETSVLAPKVEGGIESAPTAARAVRPAGVSRVFAAAAFELRLAARSRWIVACAAGFVLGATAISYFGLSGAGYAGFQGFERTAVSLLSLAIFVVPLAGLMLGLGAFSSRDGSDLAFVLPEDRPIVVAGKLIGQTAALSAAACLGFGAAGLVIAAEAGADGLTGYIALVGASIAMGAAFVGLGALAGLAVADPLQASGLAIGSWIWLVFLYELVVLGVLCLVPESSVRPLLVPALFGSPVSLTRVLVLLATGAHPALGPAGALLLHWFGSAGSLALLGAGLVAWVAVPWIAAIRFSLRAER